MKSIKIISIITLVVVVALTGYVVYSQVKSKKQVDEDVEDFPMPDKNPVNLED